MNTLTYKGYQNTILMLIFSTAKSCISMTS